MPVRVRPAFDCCRADRIRNPAARVRAGPAYSPVWRHPRRQYVEVPLSDCAAAGAGPGVLRQSRSSRRCHALSADHVLAGRRHDPDPGFAVARVAHGSAALPPARSRLTTQGNTRDWRAGGGDPACRDRLACRPVFRCIRQGHVANDERQELRDRFLHLVLPDRDQDSRRSRQMLRACRGHNPPPTTLPTARPLAAAMPSRRNARSRTPTLSPCSKKAPTTRPCLRSARFLCASTGCSSPTAARVRTAR